MAELAPFAPGRAHRIPTYNFTLSRVEMPPLPCAAGTFRKFQGFVALAIVLRTVLETGVPLWLDVPNAMAESLGLAGPPDVGAPVRL